MKQEFEGFSAYIRSASTTDARMIMIRAWEFQKRLRSRVVPDDYTEGALFGMLDCIIELARVLTAPGPVVRFSIAKRRYRAHEAVLALQDELRRQMNEDEEDGPEVSSAVSPSVQPVAVRRAG